MNRLTLSRLESSDQGTFGILQFVNSKDDGDWLESFYTGELPDRDNKPNLSCIPKGIYKVSKTYWTTHKKDVYMIQNVPNRGGVLIHAANYMGDITKGYKTHLQGCIALGERLGQMEGQKALLMSATAIRRFQEMMDWQEFELEIK